MKARGIKLDYDSQVDAAYLRLRRGKVAGTEMVGPGLMIDLDANDQVLGVEILQFSQRFANTTKQSKSVRGGRKLAG
jgi:uncharacterized protein YuzE